MGGAYSRWKGHTGGMGQCGRGIQERWGSMEGAYKRNGVVMVGEHNRGGALTCLSCQGLGQALPP